MQNNRYGLAILFFIAGGLAAPRASAGSAPGKKGADAGGAFPCPAKLPLDYKGLAAAGGADARLFKPATAKGRFQLASASIDKANAVCVYHDGDRQQRVSVATTALAKGLKCKSGTVVVDKGKGFRCG